MAKKAFQVGLALAVMTIVLSGLASAQSGCTTAIISLAPCLSYITGNSSAPSSSCCSQLASVVKSEPACLCSVLNGGASSFGITVNQTRALAMPAACKVQTPPVSECNSVAGGPAKSPTASPATPATPVPSTPSSPKSEGGSKATPATTSDGSSYKPSRPLMLSILFLAGCASFTGL
ncbi:Protease inhibitor seed storage LTP family protein precursor [Musa troglodytarum]|uniref:Protease inhibitor seed storage LTP family protein n=1 Tax=Musa troglodytarum TaxID=320322 RepID=A0A9E7F4J8_9LILI|nr:Protease inhibitor seed storage LTP family protein precursor [Musa troglodytarum]